MDDPAFLRWTMQVAALVAMEHVLEQSLKRVPCKHHSNIQSEVSVFKYVARSLSQAARPQVISGHPKTRIFRSPRIE